MKWCIVSTVLEKEAKRKTASSSVLWVQFLKKGEEIYEVVYTEYSFRKRGKEMYQVVCEKYSFRKQKNGENSFQVNIWTHVSDPLTLGMRGRSIF